MHYDCLIIDDEEALAESTAEYFNMFNIKTAYVTSANACRIFLQNNAASLLLLDINLGEDSGFELCKELRETTNIPILFISARTGDDNQIIALNIGGDDYIQKPYSLGVILAKVKAVLKRCGTISKKNQGNYHNGNLKIDFRTDRVFVYGKEVSLKAMEYKLLTYLVENCNRIITKEELFERVWEDAVTGDGTLNVHIRYLREKIEENPNEPKLIKTVWGRGYLFHDGLSDNVKG